MDSKRLDLNLLVTLEALLAEQNVTKAAARLHLSQPAVSAQLARLREYFDDPLLVPAQRGMTPTTKALELLPAIRHALDEVRAAVNSHAQFEPETATLTIAIACTDYLQTAIVQPLAVALRLEAPHIRLAMHALTVGELETQMISGDVDIALMTPQHAPPTLRSRHLFDEHYVLIGRHDHPRLRDGLSVEEFVELDHVIVSLEGGGFRTVVDEALAALGQRRNVVLSAASFLFVSNLVATSDMVALVPERLVRGDARLKSVECPIAVESFAVGMVWHERNHGHAAHRWLRERIRKLVEREWESESG